MFDYDVIVVGCGPSGLMAAAELKEKGVNVLGVDKKPKLDENVRAASGFFIDGQEMNGEYIKVEPLKGKTKITYTKCGFSLEYSKPMEAIFHTHLIVNSGKRFQATTRKKPLYRTFNPTTWLSDRYKRAKKLGVPFMTDTLAIRAKEITGGVELQLRTKGKPTTKTCRKLIASDGLQSRITRNLGLNRKRIMFGKGPTIEYEMINVDCPALPGKNAYDMIEFFTKKGPFAKWFKKAEVVETSAAIVEMFTPLNPPYQGNILIIGDAAAYAEVLYQGATMCGY
ncbi:MAG: FAD-dependent monooxygenase, partial [Deltaproteobacteria bacterium]|nr:FAD-dependent monooxygenase [Deltaproteobacteria bacterium]